MQRKLTDPVTESQCFLVGLHNNDAVIAVGSQVGPFQFALLPSLGVSAGLVLGAFGAVPIHDQVELLMLQRLYPLCGYVLYD